MRHTLSRIPLVALAVVCVGAGLALSVRAQSKPDFSGTWIMDEARSVSPHYPGFVGPVTLVIIQTPNNVTVETKRGGKSDLVGYQIVESEHTPAGTTAATTVGPPFKAYWEGLSLISEVVRDVPVTVRSKEVRTLDEGGQEMTVETTIIVEHGYTEAGAQTHSTGKDVFKKQL